jgi:hypothetical protein
MGGEEAVLAGYATAESLSAGQRRHNDTGRREYRAPAARSSLTVFDIVYRSPLTAVYDARTHRATSRNVARLPYIKIPTR